MDIAIVASLGLPQLEKIASLKLWTPSVVKPTGEHKFLAPLSQLELTWKDHPRNRASCVGKRAFIGTGSAQPLSSCPYLSNLLPTGVVSTSIPPGKFVSPFCPRVSFQSVNHSFYEESYFVMNNYWNTTSLGHGHFFLLLLFLLFSTVNCWQYWSQILLSTLSWIKLIVLNFIIKASRCHMRRGEKRGKGSWITRWTG